MSSFEGPCSAGDASDYISTSNTALPVSITRRNIASGGLGILQHAAALGDDESGRGILGY
ncbi:uncharacterized protein ColSpa_09869 [Colletotrichum spaethianum]|uniref:Uncharacterized protein n=1 Tax=Colletotrichum spaethianum TaxID=700344 RepID=A0AA37PCD5_9PEZI|nr:uncharacterized protein ColSpa_09869 [Colletotrichum spaethianum]GKT49688.1 hypothetical protein ColSpa_09869 [Colletotrichum spaethianum]